MRVSLKTGKVIRFIVVLMAVFASVTAGINLALSNNIYTLTGFILSVIVSLALIVTTKNHLHKDLSLVSEIEKETDAKEAMIASIAHEVKNPLNAIKGASQFIFDRYKNEKNIEEFTGIINDEVTRIEKYLNEFLSFSRGVQLKLKKQDMESYLTGIIMLVKHIMPCPVEIKVNKDRVPEVEIDGEQMRQVMINLLYNSRDAIAGMDSPEVRVEIDFDGKFVYVSVIDNGVGIDAGDIDKVFTPFFTTKKEGSGIGLAVSRAIVKKHGGDIMVFSSSESGTIFKIKLPISQLQEKKN